MNKLTDFNIGDKVKLTDGVLHKEYAERIGTVKKLIKSRNVVKVAFADGQTYDAYPQNVQHVELIREMNSEQDSSDRKDEAQ